MYSAQVIPQYTGPISFGMGLNGNRAFVPPPNVPLGTGPLINLRVRAADPLRRVPNISVFVPNSTTLGTASLFLRKDNYKPELLAVIPDGFFEDPFQQTKTEDEVRPASSQITSRNHPLVSLDELEQARRGFNGQKAKDDLYKKAALARIPDPFQRLQLSGVNATTFRQYHSKVCVLIKEGQSPTLPGLGRFLADKAHQNKPEVFAHASLSTWAAAVNHFSVALGYYYPTERDWLEWRKVRKGLKGMNAEGVTRVKGAITRRAVDELLIWSETRIPDPADRQWFRDGIVVQHAFGLRTSQVPMVDTVNCTAQPSAAPSPQLQVCLRKAQGS